VSRDITALSTRVESYIVKDGLNFKDF